MPHIIAGIYRIDKEIGSGGGGIVYIGEHIRLGKRIVLKADKRKVTAKPEILRREVDALKNLSHTYIPQVYDFVIEGENVYTVMDYIEGESLDKPLKRGERFSQRDIIKWSVQLLEALSYMHSREPHGILHGDIKPANIMLTPERNICLIDFNIALALGEEGAVKVGYSQGYASPEHYGIDFSNVTEKNYSTENTDTETMSKYIENEFKIKSNDLSETLTMVNNKAYDAVYSSYSSGKRSVMIDVRSDIYSLGATLYHLVTGRRPSKNIDEIYPITYAEASKSFINIIEKAMQPNPQLRYQSADEMLEDLKNLRRNDFRAVKMRKFQRITAAVLSAVFISGAAMSFIGLGQMKQIEESYSLAADSEKALAKGDNIKAISLAHQALESHGIFSISYTAEAQKALSDALGVYDLSDGMKDAGVVSLKSEALKISISQDGNYAAAVYQGGVAVIDTLKSEIIADLPANQSALSDAIFSGNDCLIYAGEEGITAYSVKNNKELWKGAPATGICVSTDGKYAASIYKDASEAIIYDMEMGKEIQRISFESRKQPVAVNDNFADPNDSIFALNNDGSMLAVSFDDGSLTLFDLNDRENDLIIYEDTEYTHFEGGFFGKYFAFSSTNDQESVYMSVDCEAAEALTSFSMQSIINVKTDESGIYLCNEGTVVKIDPVSGQQEEKAYIPDMCADYFVCNDFTVLASENGGLLYFDNKAMQMTSSNTANIVENNKNETAYDSVAYNMVVAADKTSIAGNIGSSDIRIMIMKDNSESQIFKYDSSYDHDEARVSADGKTVMLFNYKNFRLYSIDGNIIYSQDIPYEAQVYDQQYRRTGNESYLEVIYNDGTRRYYSAENGTLISEEIGEKPDFSLYEEFETERFRIESPLHGVPVVYDKKTNKEYKKLEPDDYLTYVTQTEDFIITEYITSEGDRYGLLLNENCETIAYLPYLCDFVDGKLIFDYRTGNLRCTRIYSIDELIAMADSVV